MRQGRTAALRKVAKSQKPATIRAKLQLAGEKFLPTCVLCHVNRSKLASLLLPRGIGVQGEDQLADLAHPLSAPALHAEDGHDARHARREQPQRIKGALADPHCASITVLATCGHSA